MIQGLIDKINKYDYVSFDVFDTLIYRTISDHHLIPRYIAFLYEKKYGEKLPDFYKDRGNAEYNAKIKLRREVSIDEIYNYLNYNETVSNRLKKLEKDFEVKNCVPNRQMVEIVDWCLTHGKVVVIITDMYLTPDVFDDIFKKIGIRYHYLFISGVEGVTKRSGLLFSKVLAKLSIDAQNIIHIGDDSNNDYIMPRKYGIEAVLYERRSTDWKDYLPNNSYLEKDHLRNLYKVTSKNVDIITPEFRIGYSVIGPFLFEFCQWLHWKKREKGIESLLFVAREGFLIKKAYEWMYPEDHVDYIRLNKNLLRLPSFHLSGNVETLLQTLPKRICFTWKEIITHLGIQDNDAMKFLMEERFPLLRWTEKLNRKDILNGFYNDEIEFIINHQKEKTLEQNKLLLEYAKLKGFTSKRIGLVNNSMNGNAQFLLTEILNNVGLKNDIIGLQIIKTDYCDNRLGKNVDAFITEERFPLYYQFYFRHRCLILEHMLFEPSGTARKFEFVNGSISVVCDSPINEQNDFKKISQLQNYSIGFIRDYSQNIEMPLNKMGVDSLISFLKYPIKEDAIFISELWDDDVEGSRKICAADIPFSITNICMKNIPQGVGWVEGFLSSHGVTKALLRFTFIRLIAGYYWKRLIGKTEKSLA